MSALRQIRVDKHLSTADLAAAAGISVEQIRNIEQGRTRNPRVETLSRLAEVLGVSPSAIDPMLTDERSVA